MLRIALIGFSFLFLIACKESEQNILPYYNDPAFTPLFFSKNDANLNVTHRIEDFDFIDQFGEVISSRNLDGKIHIANFFFTGCGSICPPMMKKLAAIQKKVSDDSEILFLSFSVTPLSDSVPKLKAYADLHEIDAKQWKLLTGNTSDIYRVARRSYFAEESLGFSKDSSNFLHTEHVLLVDRDRKIRGIYNGTLQLEMDQLANDIILLKQEY